MRKTPRKALRKQGYKLPALNVVSLRIGASAYERCAWMAQAKGMNRTEFIRHTLDDATKGAQPPEPRCFRGISAGGAELAEWEQVAARRGHTVESLIRWILTNAVAKDAAQKETA